MANASSLHKRSYHFEISLTFARYLIRGYRSRHPILRGIKAQQGTRLIGGPAYSAGFHAECPGLSAASRPRFSVTVATRIGEIVDSNLFRSLPRAVKQFLFLCIL